MTDLHAHLLPAMDDGSPDVKTSVAMLRRLQAQKVTAVCATPHYYRRQNAPAAFCLRRAEALGRLLAAAPPGLPRVMLGAEVAYFPQMEQQPLGLLCVEGTRTLLLEMPFADWTDLQVETVTTLALDCRYDVVLAHPERFCFSRGNRRQLARLAALPVGLQVNADSLLRRPLRGLALELLRGAAIPLLGSDCHDLARRPPRLEAARTVIRRRLGPDFLARMDRQAARLTRPCPGEAAL